MIIKLNIFLTKVYMSLQLSLLTLATVVVWVVELQTKVSEDFTIMEKAPIEAFSWLIAPNITFTLRTLLRLCANPL